MRSGQFRQMTGSPASTAIRLESSQSRPIAWCISCYRLATVIVGMDLQWRGSFTIHHQLTSEATNNCIVQRHLA
ncbi:Fusaridione A cluster transcription factor fsdR [Fusarium oxysporum f. sp. albedinis]|nr:Fusaridione A cluster transcription factor fsdR [Fusarium oxysporum f. sp. albedinis]